MDKTKPRKKKKKKQTNKQLFSSTSPLLNQNMYILLPLSLFINCLHIQNGIDPAIGWLAIYDDTPSAKIAFYEKGSIFKENPFDVLTYQISRFFFFLKGLHSGCSK